MSSHSIRGFDVSIFINFVDRSNQLQSRLASCTRAYETAQRELYRDKIMRSLDATNSALRRAERADEEAELTRIYADMPALE